MSHALILGGTKGLGRSLAITALKRGITTPIVTGRSVAEAARDPDLAGAVFHRIDIAASDASYQAKAAMRGRDIRHVFWNAGIFLKKPLAECSGEDIHRMVNLHLTGPVETLKHIHRAMREAARPYHLVVTASTSSYRMRSHETIYAMVKAGKAHFTRQFARELAAELPGSKTLLVNPGGMKSGFLAVAGVDVSGMMDTDAVADLIWNYARSQTTIFREMNILREPDGTPRVVDGTLTPETP